MTVVRCGEQVAHRVNAAALPGGALEAAADRFDQPGVRVADDEAHTGESAVGEAGEELAPERFVLAVADIEAEDLAMPVSSQSGGDHDRFRDDLAVPARLEQLREERALAELGDTDLDITARCRDQLRAMPVALRHALAGAFAGCGTDRRGELGFDQLLQRDSEDVAQRRRETRIGAEQTRGKVG